MNRRDYREAARIVNSFDPIRECRAEVASAFVILFRESPSFDRGKFLAACGFDNDYRVVREPMRDGRSTSVRPTGGTEVKCATCGEVHDNERGNVPTCARLDVATARKRGALSPCDGCGKKRRDVRSVGRDANGDPDAPDLCFLCRKKGRSAVRAKGPDGLYVVVD